MSSDNSSSTSPTHQPPSDTIRARRGSVTSAAFSDLFKRNNSTSNGTPVFPSAITTAAMSEQRRRLSVTTLGLPGSAPTVASSFGMRRTSLSTNNSDSIDENAVDDEEASVGSRTVPNTPFAGRRTSFGTGMRPGRPGGGTSPGAANDQSMSWSEQLRSRAESTVNSATRASFSFGSGTTTGSPPRNAAAQASAAAAVAPAPPVQPPKPRSPARQSRPKPDAFQERILKGDFYMD